MSRLDLGTGFGIAGIIAILALIGASFYGWVMNIVKLIDLGFSEITVELAIRVIGIFMAPVGVVMGFI